MTGEARAEWHQAKVFSIVHLLATLGMVFTAAFFVAELRYQQRQTQALLESHITQTESRITEVARLSESRVIDAHSRIDREVSRTADDLALIRAAITRMDDRIERLVDRQ